MNIYEGKLKRVKVCDTGDPEIDYDYLIGNVYLNDILEELEENEGKSIRITIEKI